ARPAYRRAGPVGLPAPVPGCTPGGDHPLLRGPALAGRDGHVPAAGRAGGPPPAHEHLPRQVARIPGRLRPWRGHPASGRPGALAPAAATAAATLAEQAPMTSPIPLSVLDLAPVCEGSDVGTALDRKSTRLN